MIPTVGRLGELAGMSSEESEPGMRAIAGPTWRNEVTGRAVFAEWTNRAITRMERVRSPILVGIADRDSVAPVRRTRAAAWRAKGRVEVRDYPCMHFDIYVGEWRERSIADQLHFLRRHLEADAAKGTGRLAPEGGCGDSRLTRPSTLTPVISDVSEQEFQAKVIERSKQVPVVVDFWAEWCGPCRTLGPAIEDAVRKRNGEIELAKVDTDRNPGIAMEYQIASIPAVKAFKDGKVVSEFIGAIPPPGSRRSSTRSSRRRPTGSLSPATRTTSARRSSSTREMPPRIGLGRILLARGETDDALETLGPSPTTSSPTGWPPARSSRRRVTEPSPDELQQAFAAWDEGNSGEALEHLQTALASEQDSGRKDQLRRVMVAIFTELGADHPLAREHRRRLAAALN